MRTRRVAAAAATAALLSSASIVVGAPQAGASPFSAGAETTIYNDSQLSTMNLEGWPDGEMGIERSGSTYTFHVPRGGGVQTRLTGTLHQPAAPGSILQFDIAGVPADVDYAAGGPVYVDAGGATRVMVTHLERWRSEDGSNFYASIGLARSTDGGASWTFLGEIVRSFTLPDDCAPGIDAGSGTSAIRNEGGTDYLYVYVHDRQNCTHINSLAVARAPLAEVMAAAIAGTVSGWTKYHNGSWSQPGIGGLSTDLWPAALPWTAYFGSVTWNTHLEKYVLVITRRHTSALGIPTWKMELLESTDGLTWSAPQVAVESAIELVYPSVAGLGDDPRETGQSFYVYYVSSTFGPSNRWGLAELKRLTITFA